MIGRITIYSPEGLALIETTIRDESRYTRKLMGEHSVRVRFDWAEAKALPYGAYIEYADRRWALYAPYQPAQTEGVALYDVAFHAPEQELRNFTAFYMSQDMMEARWSLTGTIEQYCRELRHNLRRIQGSGVWTLEHHGIDTRQSKHIDFEGTTLWDALTKVAEAFGCEWWCEADRSLHFGKLSSHTERTARLGELATSFTPQGEGNPLIGRLYAFGSTRNIGQGYRRTEGVTSRITEPRLHLPLSTPYIQGVDHGIEAVQTFEDVYPKYVGRVAKVTTRGSGDDTIYKITDASFIVPERSILAGETFKVKFESGALGGFEFEARITDGGYELVPNDSYGVRLPSGRLVPSVGDEYVPFGFNIALVGTDYVPRAEAELLRVATEWLERNNQDRRDVQLTTNPIYTHREGVRLELGERIRLVGAIPSGDKVGRITSIEYTLSKPYNMTALVGETKPEGVLSRLESATVEASNSTKAYAKKQATEAIRYAMRGLADAQEAQEAIAKAMGDKYDPTINPLAVETLQALVGNEATQFTFRRGLYNELPATLNIQLGADKRLRIGETAYIKHHTLGITELRHRHRTQAYKWWRLEPFVSLPLDYPDRLYYLYAVAERVGTRGAWLVSPDPIALEHVADKYHLLTAIIGAENSKGERSITSLYGFTEVLPGQINTSRIVSNDGATYFDLERGEIGGNIRFRGGQDADTFIREVLQAHDDSDYLHRVLLNGTTEIGGGLVASHVIALKDDAGVVRAYVDGRGDAEVAFGAGVSGFGSRDEVRNVTIRHDGSCAIGEMRVDKGTGRIGFEDTAGRYLTLGGSVDDLSQIVAQRLQVLDEREYHAEGLAPMAGNSVLTHTIRTTFTNIFVSVEGFELRTRVRLSGIKYNQAGRHTTIRVSAERSDGTRLTLAQGTLGQGTTGYYEYGTPREPRELSFSGITPVPRGALINMVLEVERPEYSSLEIAGAQIFLSGDNKGISRGAVALGGNGLAMHLSADEVFSLIKGQGLRYVGMADLPGWLASGSVTPQEVTHRIARTPYYKVVGWGAKVNARAGDRPLCSGLVNEGTGADSKGYYLIHHSVGHTRYSVSITPLSDDAYTSVSANVYHKTEHSFWVYLSRDGAPTDRAFDYTIFGPNT